jgi:cytochrome c2
MRQIRIGRRAGIGLAALACAIALGTPVALATHTTHSKAVASNPGNVVSGYQVFNDYFCVACHTLKAAGPAAYGKLGVDFDKIHVGDAAAVVTVTNGLPAVSGRC